MIDYIETVNGNKVHFLNPDPDELDIKDIAFSLSNQCRFNGHVPFFSVAEHCISVAARLPYRKQLAGLLHDASEAYLADIASPVKACLPDYKALEDNLLAAIAKKFGVEFDDDVKQADQDATYTEAYYLLKSKGASWRPVIWQPSDRYEPVCMPPREAYARFLEAFHGIQERDRIVIAPA